MRSKRFIRLIAIILAVVLLGSLIASALSYLALGAASQSEIDALKAEAELIVKRKAEAVSAVNSLEFEQKSILGKKGVLDEQVLLVTEQISNLKKQIEVYDTLMEEQQEDVDEAQARVDEQLDLIKSRVRTTEENGVLSYFTVLFTASSFTDFLARLDFIREVLLYDEEIFTTYSKAKIEVEHAGEFIQNSLEEQQLCRDEIAELEQELAEKVAVADAFMAEAQSTRESFDALCDELDEIREKLEKHISGQTAELERTRQQSILTGTGTFIWPVPTAHTVTASFGTHLNTEYSYYRMHYGIDIGAQYGAEVMSSDQGTVTVSEYNNSYGNYIVVDHGNGYMTVYANLGEILVSVGQEVGQGEVIATAGSTGESTGVRVHFEIRQRNTCINPLQFFSGYTVND